MDEQFLTEAQALAQQQGLSPANYDFVGPEFDPAQPAPDSAMIATTADASAAAQPLSPPAQSPIPQAIGTMPGVTTPASALASAPVTTPPNPASPTVDPMPNQATPGWQGHKPEFLTDPPPNMPGPTRWDVDANQTVRGQMTQALTEGNPIYDAIRSKVVSAFMLRGGKNSLRAQQAAEMIVVESAFKIAAADAQVFARSAEFNAAVKNQFSSAEQRFMHEALLSDQNFQQAKEIQRLQIEAEEARAASAAASSAAYGAAIGSAMADAAQQEQDFWIERAAISHRYNVDIIGLQNTNERGRMRLGAQLEGVIDDRRTDNLIRRDNNTFGNTMTLNEQIAGIESRASDQTYRQNWSLNEQRQAHGLETLDRTTDNAIRERYVAYGHQTALNYQSEVMNNLRSGNGLITQILSTPGLSGEQQQAAIRQIGQMTRTTDELIGSFYTALGITPPRIPATGAGSSGNLGSGAGQQPSTPSSGLGTYTDYRSYGNPYVATTAPVPGQGGGVHQGSTPPPPPT